MAFFAIERYTGETDPGPDNSPSKQADILKRLHDAAKQRLNDSVTEEGGERGVTEEGGQRGVTEEAGQRGDNLNVTPTKKRKLVGAKQPESSEKKPKKSNKESEHSTVNGSHLDDPHTPCTLSIKHKKTSSHQPQHEDIQQKIVPDTPPSSARRRNKKDTYLQEPDTDDTETPTHKTPTTFTSNKTDKSNSIGKRKKKLTLADTSSPVTDQLGSSSPGRDLAGSTVTAEASLDAAVDEDNGDEAEHEALSSTTDAGQVHEDVGGFTVIGDVMHHKTPKVHRVLPAWLSKPTVITDDIRHNRTPLEDIDGLDEDLLATLRDNGITDFFPVQSQLLPVLLTDVRSGFMYGQTGYRPCDICCSAPTGSGKTLAYVLPIVQALRQRVVTQVRALVVLPVRDLVTQVHKVFKTYCQGTSLKVEQIIGKRTFQSEQQMLVRKGPCGYHSNIDILISTPGRLVDHINCTPGFTLKHLRFLVIDEADRMMDEIKQDWLNYVETAVYAPSNQGNNMEVTKNSSLKGSTIYGDIERVAPGPLTAHDMSQVSRPLQKLLFSATLSQNPEKLQVLNLFQPRLYTSVVGSVHAVETPGGAIKESNEESEEKSKGEFVGKYTTPAGLTEFLVESNPGEKPLMMIYFIEHLKFKHILCFVNSVEAAHRLYWLIKLTCNVEVREFSSKLHADKRKRILNQFATGKIHVLICSDAVARGMDIDGVQYVMSYESPPYLKTYIHRVGRTARAGKAGTAVTLLEKKEIFHFKKMLREAGKTDIKELKIKPRDIRPFIPEYKEALNQLQDILQNEKQR